MLRSSFLRTTSTLPPHPIITALTATDSRRVLSVTMRAARCGPRTLTTGLRPRERYVGAFCAHRDHRRCAHQAGRDLARRWEERRKQGILLWTDNSTPWRRPSFLLLATRKLLHHAFHLGLSHCHYCPTMIVVIIVVIIVVAAAAAAAAARMCVEPLRRASLARWGGATAWTSRSGAPRGTCRASRGLCCSSAQRRPRCGAWPCAARLSPPRPPPGQSVNRVVDARALAEAL